MRLIYLLKQKVGSGLYKMPSRRSFKNVLQDFSGGEVIIPREELKSMIGELTDTIISELKPTDENVDGGLYVGTAGVAYALYRLSKSPFSTNRNKLLQTAALYLAPALRQTDNPAHVRPVDIPGFLLGSCGVFAIGAVLFQANSDTKKKQECIQKYFDASHICKNIHFLNCGSDELFVGRAGYICGALWMAKELNVAYPQQTLFELCNVIVMSGREYSKKNRSGSPLMYHYYGTEYLGAAHGLCAILLMLMSVPGYLESNSSSLKDVQLSTDYLLNLQNNIGNFPCATDETQNVIPPEDQLVHWCHGAPGVIYLMAKAYLLWGDQKYLKSCEMCGELIWERGLLKKGPGICHGVAGNGYVFLLLHRLTRDAKHLHRAIEFARFIKSDKFQREARTPDSPFSLFEGTAGTLCYLADLLEPETAAFPFMDVF